VPEGAIRTDEIRREENGRGDFVSGKDWKREIVVVAPAVVEGDDATRTSGPPGGVSVREQGVERDDLEVFLQDGDMTVEGGGRYDHSGLRIVQGLVPLLDHTVIGEDDHRIAFGPHPQTPLPQPATDQGLAQQDFSEALRIRVHDLLG
jgi:hypothetical protein